MAVCVSYVLLLLVLLSQIINGQGDCIDVLGRNKCRFLMMHGSCYKFRKRMMHLCPKTCGECIWQKSCKDVYTISRCLNLRRQGVCKSHVNLMQQVCPKTCEFCEENYKCKNITCGEGRYCTLDNYKKPYCSCLVRCDSHPTIHRVGPVCASDKVTYMNICVMNQISCNQRTNLYVKSYGNCPKDYSCNDSKWERLYGICERWRKAGLCKRHKKFIFKRCARTCGFCNEIADPFSCGNNDPYCCWDGKKARGPRGEGCRECKDKSTIFCRRFAADCGSKKDGFRRVMREMCPATCQFCNVGHINLAEI